MSQAMVRILFLEEYGESLEEYMWQTLGKYGFTPEKQEEERKKIKIALTLLQKGGEGSQGIADYI